MSGVIPRTATVGENTSATSQAGTLPSGTLASDYVVAVVSMPGSTAQLTGPSGGWTTIMSPINMASSTEVVAVYGMFNASAPTVSTSAAAGKCTVIVNAYSNVDPGTPLDVSTHQTSYVGAAQSSYPDTGVTTVTEGARVLTAMSVDSSSRTPVMSTGGWTVEGVQTTNVGRCTGLAGKDFPAKGASGTVTWTTSSPLALDAVVCVFALRAVANKVSQPARRRQVVPQTLARTRPVMSRRAMSAPLAQGGVWAAAWAARPTTAATWLALGDSITEGQGASVLGNRWVTKCADLMRTRPGSPSAVGGVGWIGAASLTVGPDSAWTSPTSPIPVAGGGATLFNYFWQTLDGKGSTTNATNDTITWTFTGTSVDTWVIDSSAPGTYQIDALSTVALTNGGNFPALRVQHSAGVTSGTHTVQIKQTGSGLIGVDGIMVYNGDETTGLHVYNTGHFGALTSDLLNDWGTGDAYTYLQPFWLQQVSPDVATVAFGANEFLNNISPTTFQSNIRKVIQLLQSLPKIPTIYLLAMPVFDDGSTHTFRWTAYQAALSALATETPGVVYVDVMAVTGVPTVGGLFSTDQIHPSNSGHALIAQFMSGILAGNPALPAQPHKRPRRHLPPRRRPADATPVPAQQTPAAPARVPQRRAPARVLVAWRRQRGDSGGPLSMQDDIPQSPGRRRSLFLRRRPATVSPVPVQVFAGPPFPVRPSLPRRMGRRLARPSAVTPVPVQVVPPPAWVPVRPMLRRVVAVLRRQHTAAAPVDQAGAPAAARVRVRPTLRRRPSVAGPVPAQVVVPPSWVPQRALPRRVAAVVRRQRGDTAPPLDQGGPVAVPTRRWRAPWRRRPSAVLPVPPQVFAGPAYPPAPSGPRRRGMLPRRARVSTPVPAQQFVGPAFVPQKTTPRRVLAAVRRRVPAGPPVDQGAVVAGQQRRLRFAWRRRPVVAVPVAAQEAPARVAPVRRPPAAAAASRVRRSVSPPIPQATPPAARPTRARLATIRTRRGKVAQPARPQDVIPAYPVRPSSPRRVLAAVRGLRRLTPKWIGVGLPAGVRPGRMTDGTTRGPAMDTGTTQGAQMTTGYRTAADADTADDVTEGG